jgi:hypothetical protein
MSKRFEDFFSALHSSRHSFKRRRDCNHAAVAATAAHWETPAAIANKIGESSI